MTTRDTRDGIDGLCWFSHPNVHQHVRQRFARLDVDHANVHKLASKGLAAKTAQPPGAWKAHEKKSRLEFGHVGADRVADRLFPKSSASKFTPSHAGRTQRDSTAPRLPRAPRYRYGCESSTARPRCTPRSSSCHHHRSTEAPRRHLPNLQRLPVFDRGIVACHELVHHRAPFETMFVDVER